MHDIAIYDEAKDDYFEQNFDDTEIRMYLMMSDHAFNPEEILNKSTLKSTYMNLSVPKFNIEYDDDITPLLQNIGINKAFGSGAEFTKICDGVNMYFDSVIHKTYISVNEEGTEAAAVTAVLLFGAPRPPEPIDVFYNKPFTFVIKDDKNGEILFMGEYAFAETSDGE